MSVARTQTFVRTTKNRRHLQSTIHSYANRENLKIALHFASIAAIRIKNCGCHGNKKPEKTVIIVICLGTLYPRSLKFQNDVVPRACKKRSIHSFNIFVLLF